ncbi:MAG: aldehyde dehydrogenase family protein [Actinomycetota bacterium]
MSTQHFIGGAFVEAEGKLLPSINPSTGKQIGEVAVGSEHEINEAVEAAWGAFDSTWELTPAPHRRKMMLKLAQLMVDRAGEIASLVAEDMGMPVMLAYGETLLAAEWLEYYAGWADKIGGEIVPVGAPGVLDYTLYEPIGVVGAIIPWNAPVSITMFKLGPALAGGNCVVLKPSEFATRPILKLMELVSEAGFPSGVIECVTGDGSTGKALVEHPRVGAISFTGGGHHGRTVAETCGRMLKRVTLELGGKSANIVFADADLESAAAQSAAACFLLTGQQCVAGSRLLVQEQIKDEFVERVAASSNNYVVGDASRPDVQIGPLVNTGSLDRVQTFVDEARNEATVVVGGRRKGGDLADGYFFEPTILTDVKNDMRVARDEVFGPVLSVIPFSDSSEAIHIANDTQFGLAGGVWTNDLNKAHMVARGVRAGTIWVNSYLALNPGAPFGGYKESGIGREGGREAIGHYTETKNVYIQLRP